MVKAQPDLAMIDSNKLIFGIGQVQKITGTSGRQLRYWESQGYVTPINQQKGVQRQYTLHSLFLIFRIQKNLKDGFTLQAAVEKARELDEQIPVLRAFLRNQFQGVTMYDDRSEIDLGFMNESKKQRVYGVVKDGETFFRVENVAASAED